MKVLEGYFVERKNRFTCLIKIRGKLGLAYLPNPGRLREVLTSNNKLFLIKRKRNKFRRGGLRYEIIGSELGKELVSLDSRFPNRIIYENLMKRKIEIFGNYDKIIKEYRVKGSRFDFLLLDGEKKKLLEVKSVTLVVKGIALFPDAPTERGAKHLLEMSRLIEEGYDCYVLFVIQRSDAKLFKPNKEVDKKFYEAFKIAYEKGVKISAIKFKKISEFNKIELNGYVKVSLD
ncbi:MAG: DNA/RNA nuclease SfsA [Nitrososphaerales archaeon]